MADPQTNPFGSYSPEDQQAIRKQLLDLSSSGQLNPAQQKSIALALTSMGAASGLPNSTVSAPPESPSLWDKANTGLVSPETILKLANAPMSATAAITGGPKPYTMEQLQQISRGSNATKRSPLVAGLESGLAGTVADTASTLSGFTSPTSLSTVGLSKIAQGTGAAAKVAKTLLTLAGLTYGATGAANTAEGIGKGVTTPEGAQETLGGLAQIAGAAPAGAEVGRLGQGAMEAIFPKAFAQGRAAFLSAVGPKGKIMQRQLSNAYKTVQPELDSLDVKSLPELATAANVKRAQAAQELTTELAKTNPQATTIDPNAVYLAIRGQITRAMQLGGPAEAKALAAYADRVRDSLKTNPVNISQAEALVQELNPRVQQFQRMTPDAKRAASAQGDTAAGEVAFKDALQAQIEQKLAGYKDLKVRYGAWKEIENQANEQILREEAKNSNPSWLTRHGTEAMFELPATVLGTLFGGHGGGYQGSATGGAIGYLAGRYAAHQYLEHLASPERVLQRGLHPQPETQIPFMGQVVQPTAESLMNSGGSAF